MSIVGWIAWQELPWAVCFAEGAYIAVPIRIGVAFQKFLRLGGKWRLCPGSFADFAFELSCPPAAVAYEEPYVAIGRITTVYILDYLIEIATHIQSIAYRTAIGYHIGPEGVDEVKTVEAEWATAIHRLIGFWAHAIKKFR